MITGTNESKTLTKYRSYQFNSDQWWNKDKRRCKFKKRRACENDYSWNPCTCNCENGKHLASIMFNSSITCDEIIDVEETNCNEKNV